MQRERNGRISRTAAVKVCGAERVFASGHRMTWGDMCAALSCFCFFTCSDAADDYSRVLKLKTYDYLDKMLYDMQDKVDTLNVQYASQMYE